MRFGFESLIWTFLMMWIVADVGGGTTIGAAPEATPQVLEAADGGDDFPPPPPTGP